MEPPAKRVRAEADSENPAADDGAAAGDAEAAAADAHAADADAARRRLEALTKAVLLDPGLGAHVYGFLTFDELNEARLSCKPVRNAIADAPLCPPVLDDDMESCWPVKIVGRRALRRFRRCYPCALSLFLAGPAPRDVPNDENTDDQLLYLGVREFAADYLPGITSMGISVVACDNRLEVLSVRGCPGVTGAVLRGCTPGVLRKVRLSMQEPHGFCVDVLGPGDGDLDALSACTHVSLSPAWYVSGAGVRKMRRVRRLRLDMSRGNLAGAFDHAPPLEGLSVWMWGGAPPLPAGWLDRVGGSLRALLLSRTPVDADVDVAIDVVLRPCAGVTRAELLNFGHLTDAGLRALASATEVVLESCPAVRGEGLPPQAVVTRRDYR